MNTVSITSDNDCFLTAGSLGLARALLDISLDCVKIIDRDGRLVMINRQVLHLMEFDDSTCPCGRYWENLWPEESRSLIRSALQAALAGETRRFSAQCPTAKGTMKSWDVRLAPVFNNYGVIDQVLAISRDVTAMQTAMSKVQQSYDMLSKLTQQAPGVLYQFQMHPDGKFSIPYVALTTENLFEITPADMQQDAAFFFSRLYEEDREVFFRSVYASAASLQPWHLEFRVLLPKQGLCWREGKSNPERLADGSILWHGFVTDITERKRTEWEFQRLHSALQHQATHDALTGLPNRRLFRDRLDQEIRHAERGSRHIALLFLDIDRFKEVNDVMGHDAGDMLLRQSASRIRHCVRPADTIARLGGDEFTIILTEVDDVEGVAQIAQRIVDALAQPFHIRQQEVRSSASIGITIYPNDAQSAEALVCNADQAMYLSKAAGRNQFSFFKQSMQVAAIERLQLISELRQAVPKRQLEVHFQPIVDMSTGAIVKAEALVRWHHPVRGMVPPAAFIGIAEETGLINEVGDWVFMEAAGHAKRWSTALGKPFQISINKSPVQFLQEKPELDWLAHLAKIDLPGVNIAVEITEGVLLNLTDKVSSRLKDLCGSGIQLSMDDFGTGYSSMSYLKKLDIDYLKIDQSFVRDMLHNDTSKTIAKTIIMMGHQLGLKVIAEGVELAEQRDWLRAEGCDYAQGFFYSKPVPSAVFEQLLFP